MKEFPMRNIEEEANLPTPKKCGRFLTAHDIHYIRARHSWTATWRDVEKVEMDGDFIVFVVDGDTVRGWNHEPSYVQALIDSGRRVKWCERYGILSFEAPGGGSSRYVGVDSVASPEECTGTRTDGFVIEGRKLLGGDGQDSRA
ncbi:MULTISPECIES: hypothetical protein [Trueperella]|uniref:Uncharacterized protein n=2 Tax=Trueperella bernardiae TaxID=59561 RepID=A0AAW6ZHD6_9ACTO|nr:MULTISPECIES: hypothetical protein [Trueperella]MCM3907482.1 hypothetical protein [Trueperella bernardiae]MDK8601729.1 hypothetical protein [Trueperella bernardiae]OFS65486.1 hypothetical protein HMPREF3174_07820 [Trueperella sp. HMSC08H06]OFS74808.1 hypothetical protein HMPREF3167_04620 [Trueperella sp. HMSC08B05]